MRTLALLLLGAAVLPAHAQIGDKVRRMLVGDTAAPPGHDTAWIASYRSNLTLSALVKYQGVDVDIEPDGGDGPGFSTNSAEQYGLGLNFKWLSVEATFNIPALDAAEPGLGSTRSRSFGLGFTGRRLWARGFWNRTTGYYLTAPERWVAGWEPGDAPVVRGDLSCRTLMLSVNYALSGRHRYSQNAALFQLERQKKSAGTFVAGLSAWVTRVGCDSSLLSPALVDTFRLASGFRGIDRVLAGASIGYAHTFAFWHKGFLNLSLLPGLTYARQSILTPQGKITGTGLAAVTELKAGLGYNGDRWYTALTLSYYYSTVAIAEKLNLGMNYSFARFALGIRLGDPGIKALGKFGL